jgi:hypothetical protein
VADTVEAELEGIVRHLASIERASCSAGEHQAAEWIAGRLRERGLAPRLEEETAHGTYWIPLGLVSALGSLAGFAALRGRRRAAAALGALAAAGVWTETEGGRHRFRRAFLSKRRTWNVVAETGDAGASRAVVVFAHHDAARSGLLFHPGVLETIEKRAPQLIENAETSPPLWALVFAAPVASALGALTGVRKLMALGAYGGATATAVFTEMAWRPTVPGANDNLSGVAVVVGLARAFSERPLKDLRVILVSCGSEESLQEGINGYLARHGHELPPETTDAICVDSVGSPGLCVPEGEAMLLMHDYDPGLKDLLSDCGAELGIGVRRGLRFGFSSDAIAWLRRGHRTVLLGSINHLKAPSNYHWPSDHADNVEYGTIADATRLVESAIRRLAV